MSSWTEWTQALDEMEGLRYEKRYRDVGGGVARIVLDRPQVMNAVDLDLQRRLMRAMLDANRDRSIGVLIITHEGQHFGVGGNVSAIADNVDSAEFLPGAITADYVVQRMVKPVIAAVRGYAVGFHNHFAYHCDFTIAGESAVFGQAGPRVGSPASGALVATSAAMVGMKRARQMWMLTTPMTAQQALAWGLVNAVVQDRLLEREVERWCATLLDRVPASIAGVKQTFDQSLAPLAATNPVLTMLEPDFPNHPDVLEAVAAFVEKRKPDYWSKRA